MKASPLFVLLAVTLLSGRVATAQAAAEAGMLTGQVAQTAGTKKPAIIPKVALPGAHAGAAANTEEQPRELLPTDSLNRIPGDCRCAKEPFFSVNSSQIAPGTEVTIASPSPDAVIYFTTDGWTPTSASPRYTGPIPIVGNTHLQAIAEEPQKSASLVVDASYTVDAASDAPPASAMAANGMLAKGTPLRFVTALSVSSETAHVGDSLPLILDENILAGTAVAVPNGARGNATITHVQRAGPGGKPGMLVFEVQSLSGGSVTIPLSATLTLQAPDQGAKARRLSNPTMVHVAGGLPSGDEADILPGTALTAVVAADTPVHP